MGRSCCICETDLTKYCCPGCRRYSCGTKCFETHKSNFQCLGTKTVVPFEKDNFNQDFRFLESIGKSIENNSRFQNRILESKLGLNPTIKSNLTSKQLKFTAASHRVLVRTVPGFMQRRIQNTTKFTNNRKHKKLKWRIEWIIYHPTTNASMGSTTHIHKAVSQDSILHEILPFDVKGNYKILIKDYSRPSNERGYFVLDRFKTLSESLADILIIEFPTLYAVEESLITAESSNKVEHTTNLESDTESVDEIPGIKLSERDADQSSISSTSSLDSIRSMEEVIAPPPEKDVQPPPEKDVQPPPEKDVQPPPEKDVQPPPLDIQRYHKLDLSLVDDIRGPIAGYFQDKPLYYKLI